MTKTRQFLAGVVIGLGIGMASMIGIEIGTYLTSPDVPTLVSTEADFASPTRHTIHLNESARVDMSDIIWMPREAM